MKGNIVRKIKDKGYGFILGEDGKDYFFHMSKLSYCSWEDIGEGDAVVFEDREQRGKLVAYKVEKYYGVSGEKKLEEEKVYAGIHPMVNLESYSEEEKNIIGTLGKTFYVTNSGEKILLGSNSEYRYCLVKPTDFFCEQFNLKREIIVIFSEYEHFEPRTFDAISEVYKKNTQHFRIDRICSIIISKDNKVEEEIHHILQNDIEMQVVIPFSYSELQGGECKNLITKRFKDYFYERDLFAFESPLKKDIYFFGRRDYVHELLSRHNSGENSGVFGLRRSGKTSVLQAIERAAIFTDTECVFIDCQDLYHYSWNLALFFIIDAIRKKINLSVVIEKNAYDDNANRQFALDLEMIIRQSQKDILLLFDEIEQISPKLGMENNWKDGDDFVKFWQTIRSNFHKWGNGFTFILAGTNPSAIEQISINKHDNPLYNQLKAESYIPPFYVNDTKDMVNKLGGYMGLVFDDIVCAKLTQDFGGHPYLIRHFCSTINQYVNEEKLLKPVTISTAIYNKVMPVFVEKSADNYCRFILKVLEDYYPEENAFLENLALGNLRESEKYDPQMIAHLLGYGIIESNQGVLGFKVEVLKNYLSRKFKYKRQNLTNEEKWAEISERRNRLEPKLRTIVRMQLKAKYGTQAKQKVLGSMRSNLKIKYQNLQYKDLFDPKKCEIYFSQLGNLIDKYWEECFKNIFSKNKKAISTYFTEINMLRLECHAAPVTDEEMDSFRGAIKQLEKEVANYID